MLLRILSFALIVGVTSCGGDSDDIPALSGSEAAKEDLTVSNSNSDLTVEKTNLGTVYITGDNNIIRFTGTPDDISITGNDNTVYKPASSELNNKGSGNIILEEEDSGSRTIIQ
jgi:hypothetical protein